MPGQPLPPALISSMAGILLSLVFSHIPALAGWFNRLGEYPNLSQYGRKQDRRARKPQVMLALRLRVPPAAFILAYSLWLAAVDAVGSPPAVPAASNPQSEIRNSSIRNPKFELRNLPRIVPHSFLRNEPSPSSFRNPKFFNPSSFPTRLSFAQIGAKITLTKCTLSAGPCFHLHLPNLAPRRF